MKNLNRNTKWQWSLPNLALAVSIQIAWSFAPVSAFMKGKVCFSSIQTTASIAKPASQNVHQRRFITKMMFRRSGQNSLPWMLKWFPGVLRSPRRGNHEKSVMVNQEIFSCTNSCPRCCVRKWCCRQVRWCGKCLSNSGFHYSWDWLNCGTIHIETQTISGKLKRCRRRIGRS